MRWEIYCGRTFVGVVRADSAAAAVALAAVRFNVDAARLRASLVREG